MKKLFTTMALGAALLLPSLAMAQAPSISSILPAPVTVASGQGYFSAEGAGADSGQALVSNSNLFSFNIETNCKNGTLYITSGSVTYKNAQGDTITENLPNLGTANISTIAGRKTWGKSTSNPNNMRAQVNLTAIKNAGASEFTVTLLATGATSGYSGKNFNDPGMDGVTVDGEYVSITYLTGIESGGDGGDDGDDDTEYSTEFAWDTELTLGANKVLTIPQGSYSGPMYVVTDSKTNLATMTEESTNLPNFLFTNNSWDQGVAWDEVTLTDEGYVYVKYNLSGEWIPFYIRVPGSPVHLTFKQGTYGSSGDTFTATPIDWEQDVNVPSYEGTYYSFTGKGGVAHIVTNVKDDITIGDNFYIFYGTDTSDRIDLTYVSTADGGIYNTGYLQADATYGIYIETAVNNTVISLWEGAYDAPAVELSLNDETTLNPNQVYYYEAAKAGKLVIQTQTEESYFDGNNILWADEAHSTALTYSTASNDTGAYFTVNVTEGETVYIYFTYPSYIMATLSYDESGDDGDEQPDYMGALPTLYMDNDPNMPALFVYWNEAIETVEEDAAFVTATLTTPSGETEEVAMTLTSYWPEAAEGDVVAGNNALILPMGSYVALNGEGSYAITIEAGVVKNTAGEVNSLIDDGFQVEFPKLSEVEPTLSVTAEQIVISWDGEPIEEYNPYGDEIQIFPADYSSEGFRLNAENGVTITGDSIVIDIEALELEEGKEYEILVPENYVYVGEDKLGNELIDQTFSALATGVASIHAAIEDGVTVYTINGVKVSEKNLGKGLYIINGKKTIIR